jgi:hypothetical protein
MVFALGASAGRVRSPSDGDAWVVPAGVCSVWIDAFGASGGNAFSAADDEDLPIVSPGGEEMAGKAHISVTPGEALGVRGAVRTL